MRWLSKRRKRIANHRNIMFAGQQAGIGTDAMLELFVRDGEYPSKGAARRELGITVAAEPVPWWRRWLRKAGF